MVRLFRNAQVRRLTLGIECGDAMVGTNNNTNGCSCDKFRDVHWMYAIFLADVVIDPATPTLQPARDALTWPE